MSSETATFGAGCFWGVEWVFMQVPGVTQVVSGYAGGHTVDPTYQQVSSHTTGHAEVVQVTFDPDRVSYEQLLEVFWAMHDPTQVDRQGPDVGDQYRSIVLTHSEEQRRTAEMSKAASAAALLGPDRHADHRPRGLLSGGGISPAVLLQERASALLSRVAGRDAARSWVDPRYSLSAHGTRHDRDFFEGSLRPSPGRSPELPGSTIMDEAIAGHVLLIFFGLHQGSGWASPLQAWAGARGPSGGGSLRLATQTTRRGRGGAPTLRGPGLRSSVAPRRDLDPFLCVVRHSIPGSLEIRPVQTACDLLRD